jgi:hypothetical protein
MKITRKIQVAAAAAVAANGALVLGLLSPSVALACPATDGECLVTCPTPSQQLSACRDLQPGCTVIHTQCILNAIGCPAREPTLLGCAYI